MRKTTNLPRIISSGSSSCQGAYAAWLQSALHICNVSSLLNGSKGSHQWNHHPIPDWLTGSWVCPCLHGSWTNSLAKNKDELKKSNCCAQISIQGSPQGGLTVLSCRAVQRGGQVGQFAPGPGPRMGPHKNVGGSPRLCLPPSPGASARHVPERPWTALQRRGLGGARGPPARSRVVRGRGCELRRAERQELLDAAR
ncbi:Cocaine- and amphetamine-regulated transcript protein [Platysternon megacephalum]|uniref:Cocaine-and amphetamine-regulated transcript protein n=1 Tax=Platysternon megacephalum TaxID=55544 RepID=A0A4D9DQB5_9SAUR|nr:Cocaine- and amphetamine-regulated transcript protein [Platysternon megacephalum]